MRIACPDCAAAYDVPEDRLAPGRVVRCARCASDWVPIPARAEPEPAALVAPIPAPAPQVTFASPADIAAEPKPAEHPYDPPARRRSGGVLLALAWLVSLGLVAGAVYGAYVERDAVMRAWPPSVRAYQALGLIPQHAGRA